MTTLRIIGPAWSRTFRCLWMLEECPGLSYIHDAKIQPGQARDYVRSGKVPILIDGDLQLTESSAIVTYLAEEYAPHLYPFHTTREKAFFNQTVSCIMTELDATLWIHRKHKDMGNVFGTIPEAVTKAEEQFHRMNKQMALQLNPYVCGKDFTAADILYVHCLDWAKSIGWTKSNEQPAIQEYLTLCHERPAYQRAKEIRKSKLQLRRGSMIIGPEKRGCRFRIEG